MVFLVNLLPSALCQNAGGVTTRSMDGTVPFSLANWFSLVILTLWVLISATIGDLRAHP